MSLATARRICRECDVPQYHARAFVLLANEGRIDNDKFGVLLCFDARYEQAQIAVMCVLSINL